jgi:hypothetical protein
VAKFCGKCGYPLNEALGSCGNCANQRDTAAPARPAPLPVPKNSSGLLKVVLVLLALLVVGGALAVAGIFYAAHKVSQKAHEYSAQILGNEPSHHIGTRTNDGSQGDVCRFLSKEEVGNAIGIPIAATSSTDGGCSYLAKGTMAEMTSKHMAAMLKGRGVDAQQRETIEKIAGGFFGSLQNQTKEETEDADGNAVVLAISVDSNAAAMQMKLNRRVFGGLSPDAKNFEGIGDEAFEAAGSMMMIRKDDKLIRLMFTSCPCTVDEIKPLAQKLARAL